MSLFRFYAIWHEVKVIVSGTETMKLRKGWWILWHNTVMKLKGENLKNIYNQTRNIYNNCFEKIKSNMTLYFIKIGKHECGKTVATRKKILKKRRDLIKLVKPCCLMLPLHCWYQAYLFLTNEEVIYVVSSWSNSYKFFAFFGIYFILRIHRNSLSFTGNVKTFTFLFKILIL